MMERPRKLLWVSITSIRITKDGVPESGGEQSVTIKSDDTGIDGSDVDAPADRSESRKKGKGFLFSEES